MKFLILLSLIACVYSQYPIIPTDTNCGKGTAYPQSRITGGTIAAKGNFGWTVSIHQNGNLICGGSIVNSIWVITAANCVFGKDPNSLSIDFGVQDRNSWDSWSVTRKVRNYVVHNAYQSASFRNDIAMIRLTAPVTIDTFAFKIVPICIPTGMYNYEGSASYITGYGSSVSGGASSRYLMKVQTKVLTDARCRSKFAASYAIDSVTQLCAGEDFQNQDFCQYDNGGPLAVAAADGRWHLVGIASWGKNPCGNGGVYTRVSAYASFITYTINSN